MERPLRYGMRILIDAPFADAITATRIALADAGFSAVVDVGLRSVTEPNFVILAVSSPALTRRALAADPDAGLLLPWHVVVREGDDLGSIVEVVDPLAIIALAGLNDELRTVALEARTRFESVLAALEEAAAPRGRVLHVSAEHARPSAGGG